MNVQTATRHPRFFTEDEVLAIREGVNGVFGGIPSRFYYDEEIYQWEVENILKKQWLLVGRADEAANPGDYFTIRMFDEPIVIVRGKDQKLRALINVCQHRFAQIVEEGRGNAKLFMCPFHRWTYALDGQLMGISVQDIPGVNKKDCRMPELRLDVWHGFVFINFDANAEPIANQYKALDPVFETWGVADFECRLNDQFDAPWNWKITYEAGMEGYHHVGVHHDRIEADIPAKHTDIICESEITTGYRMWWKDGMPEKYRQPFGTPPGEMGVDWDDDPRVLFGFPTFNTWINNYQSTYIVFEYGATALTGKGRICQAFPKWALETEHAEEALKFNTEFAREVQYEDEFASRIVQQGITSKTNGRALFHPLEKQMNRFHNWYLDRFLVG
jgi:phenylpropionate dioxygenase-like ring-hydroxylating dioxygenase large terminal subunit